MRFDQGSIREIHARVDIAAFIGEYVPLRKRGNDLVGLCPFHGEKTPSFHVHPDRGFFKCFGCGVGGDVITFLQKLENVTFTDAVRMLAARAGIELEPEDPRTARVRSEKEAIYEANNIAAAFFARMLHATDGPEAVGAKRAREYLEKRGFSKATIAEFQLGYAPDEWDGLTKELERNGVDLAIAEKAGLLKPGQRGYYDFYRDRLMIPTFATTGEVIAFGGRALGDVEPKYLNTTTTPVYTKGRYLFGLHIARRAVQRKPATQNDAGEPGERLPQTERTLIVVEGYLDCIALHQAGFGNTVAALGTAFTHEQALELRKYADNIFLCFDADAAGATAAGKAIDIAANVLEHAGSSVRIVMLPEDEDPDSFIRAHGAEGFRALLDAAKPSLEFKLDPQLDRLQAGFDSPAIIARKAEALIRELAPREEWDRWRVYVASRLQVHPDDLRNSRFFSHRSNFEPRGGGNFESRPGGNGAGSRHARADIEPLSFEREVLTLIIEDPALAREYVERIPPARFRNSVYRRMYERIVEYERSAEQAQRLRETGDLFTLFSEDQASLDVLMALGQRDRSKVRYEEVADSRAHLDLVVERLQLIGQQERYQELSHQIDELLTAGQPIPSDVRGEFEALVTKLKK